MNEQNGDALCVWYASDWLIPVCNAFIVRRARTLNSQIKFRYDIYNDFAQILSWWRHQMETFSTLVAIYVGKSSVIDEFPVQRPVTRSFNVFSLICVWINDWVNNREAGDLIRYRAHYDVTVMHRPSSNRGVSETVLGTIGKYIARFIDFFM